MHDFGYDPVHDEIVVTSPLAQAILTFRGAATGEEAPIRVIQGNKTGLYATGAMDKVTVDGENGEIYITTPMQDVRVFARESNGNAAPIRILTGPDTQLSTGQHNVGLAAGKGGGSPTIRIDPINNLLLVPVNRQNKVLVFDRTASGNTPPRAVIKGPVGMGNQFEVYAPKLRLVTHTRGNIEIWKIPMNGESTEPPLKIPAPLGRQSNDIGIVLDPVHKEVIIATAAGNNIMTFSVPEVFD